MGNWPAFVDALMNSAPGSIARRFPTFWNDGEGGIDFGAPQGTPVIALADGRVVGAGYFCNASGSFRLTSDAGACDHGVVTTRVTNQDGSQTDLYYQHIILSSAIKPCFDGAASCGGQTVKKGDVIGFISNFGMLEMGVNVGNSPNPPPWPHGWGTIWGADPSPGPHVDPEPYLRALISGQNTTGTIPGAGLGTTSGGGVDPLGAVNSFFGSLGGLLDWLKNPVRLIKMAVGIMLIGIALVLLVAPSYGEAFHKAFTTAKKHPEMFA